MQTKSLNEALNDRGQKHLLVGDGFVERYRLGCDLDWVFDEIVAIDKNFFHEFDTCRTERSLESLLESTSILGLLTAKPGIQRAVSFKRLTRKSYVELFPILSRFETIHSPTLMPIVEIMSVKVLDVNLHYEMDVNLVDLASRQDVVDEVLRIYESNSPENIGSDIFELRDYKSFVLLCQILDIRNYCGKETRDLGDQRAFGSKLLYSLNNLDWRAKDYENSYKSRTWDCQPLEAVEGVLFIFAEDFSALRSDDRACELIASNKSITEVDVIADGNSVHVFANDMSLFSRKANNRLSLNFSESIAGEDSHVAGREYGGVMAIGGGK